MTALYPFQQAAVDEIEAKIAEDHRNIILVAPTGSGKTVIAAEMIKRAVERHRRVLVLDGARSSSRPAPSSRPMACGTASVLE
jgi:superfamily II DNA or RNA helicase